jgi:hypothetical protein
MSATEALTAPAPVEEVKPTETVPVTESSAPAAEAPKVEEVAAPVRLFFFLLHFFVSYLFKEATKAEVTKVDLPPFPAVSLLTQVVSLSQRTVPSPLQAQRLLLRMPSP